MISTLIESVTFVCTLPFKIAYRFTSWLIDLGIAFGINIARKMLPMMGNAMQAVGTNANVTGDDRNETQTEVAPMGRRLEGGRSDETANAKPSKRSRSDSSIDKTRLKVIEGIEVASWFADELEEKCRVHGKLARRATTNEKYLEDTLDDLLAGYTPRDPPPSYTLFPDVDMELPADSPAPPPIVPVESQDHQAPPPIETVESQDHQASPPIMTVESQDHQEPCENEQRDSGADSNAKPEPPRVTRSHEVAIRSKEDTDSQPRAEADADMDLYTQDIPPPPDYDARATYEEYQGNSENTPSLYDQARHERETFQTGFFNPPNSQFQKFSAQFSLPWGVRGWYFAGKLIFVHPAKDNGRVREG